jgi:hypothetical protein
MAIEYRHAVPGAKQSGTEASRRRFSCIDRPGWSSPWETPAAT